MAPPPNHSSDSAVHDSVQERWRAAHSGQHYDRGRFGGERARTRDPRLIANLLRRFGPAQGTGRVLDVPCGTGRLFPLLSTTNASYLGLDVSEFMLGEGTSAHLARADVRRLPLHANSFDAVICCRLLHHLREPEQLRSTLSELLRVAKGPVIASFWDAASLPAWRARHGLRRRAHAETRVSLSKRELEQHLRACDAEILGYAHSCRFLSQQTFFAAHARGAARVRATSRTEGA